MSNKKEFVIKIAELEVVPLTEPIDVKPTLLEKITSCKTKPNDEYEFVIKMEAIYEVLTNKSYIIYNGNEKTLISDNLSLDQISDLFRLHYRRAKFLYENYFDDEYEIKFWSLKSCENKTYQIIEKIISISNGSIQNVLKGENRSNSGYNNRSQRQVVDDADEENDVQTIMSAFKNRGNR